LQENVVSQQTHVAPTSTQRMLAFWWYAWGQTVCYWGIRTAERALFRCGVALYSRAVKVWPEFALAYYRRGLIRGRELSQHREALADLSTAIRLEPEWPEPYLQRGLFQRFHGEPRAAIADLERYLALGGDVYWRIEAERQIHMLRDEIQE
jgi:tetratricopeptide (TPR) repeat protein